MDPFIGPGSGPLAGVAQTRRGPYRSPRVGRKFRNGRHPVHFPALVFEGRHLGVFRALEIDVELEQALRRQEDRLRCGECKKRSAEIFIALCRTPIPRQRLVAMPDATRCTDCQDLAESNAGGDVEEGRPLRRSICAVQRPRRRWEAANRVQATRDAGVSSSVRPISALSRLTPVAEGRGPGSTTKARV